MVVCGDGSPSSSRTRPDKTACGVILISIPVTVSPADNRKVALASRSGPPPYCVSKNPTHSAPDRIPRGRRSDCEGPLVSSHGRVGLTAASDGGRQPHIGLAQSAPSRRFGYDAVDGCQTTGVIGLNLERRGSRRARREKKHQGVSEAPRPWFGKALLHLTGPLTAAWSCNSRPAKRTGRGAPSPSGLKLAPRLLCAKFPKRAAYCT
jgi:hypothetical protein